MKPESEFNSQGKYCKECHRARGRAWRSAHPDKNKDAQAKYRRTHHESLLKYSLTYRKAYYKKNKARLKPRLKENSRKMGILIKKKIFAYLSSHPCVDCGESRILRLCFDHRKGVKKEFDIGAARYGRFGWKRIEAEIAKCDVRCVGCHAEKTAKERNYISWRILSGRV